MSTLSNRLQDNSSKDRPILIELSCKRPDILTDSRVYSPVEYTKTKIVAYLYSVSGKFMRIHTNCVDRISTQKGFEESWSRFRAGMSRGARINVIDLRKVTTKNERLRSSE